MRLDPFDRSHLPADQLDRRERVRLLRAAADALIAGREVPRDAALYLGGALAAWLEEEGSSLEKDFLRVRAPRGCHLTPQALAERLDDDS